MFEWLIISAFQACRRAERASTTDVDRCKVNNIQYMPAEPKTLVAIPPTYSGLNPDQKSQEYLSVNSTT